MRFYYYDRERCVKRINVNEVMFVLQLYNLFHLLGFIQGQLIRIVYIGYSQRKFSNGSVKV